MHIGVSGNENQAWFDQCLASLKGEPVNIHLVDAVPGNLGRMRLDGFSRGTSPWVTYVDPDDYITPGAFHRALPHLISGVSAYYTNHAIVDEKGNRKGPWFHNMSKQLDFTQVKQMHHIVIYNREIIAPVVHLLDGSQSGELEPLNLHAVRSGRVIGTPREEYSWRIHPEGVHLVPGCGRYDATNEWVRKTRKEIMGLK